MGNYEDIKVTRNKILKQAHKEMLYDRQRDSYQSKTKI